MRNLLGSLCLVLLVGCSSDPEPVPMEEYCTRLSAAFCDGLVRNCGCGDVTEQSCRATIATTCMTTDPTFTASIGAGVIRYDGMAAARLMEKLTSASPNCELGIAADWRPTDFFTSQGVWTGNKIAGATCLFPSIPGMPNDCGNGACSISRRVCVGGVGEGEACDAVHSCYDMDAQFPTSLRCDAAELGSQTTCMPYLQTGETCTSPNQCATGFCESTQCAFGLSLAAFGQACTSDGECVSNYCMDGTCGHAVCGDFAPRE